MRNLFLILGCAVGALGAELPKNAAELFKGTNVWNVALEFEEAQWKAMEPKGGASFGPFGGGPRGGGPGGPGGPRMMGPGPGGPGGPGLPGGPGGFGGGMPGPSMFLTPVFFRDGDANSDGKLSKEEFVGLGGKWFASWDKKKAGKVGNDEIAEGLNDAIIPPAFRGRNGGPPRMNLQGPEGKRNGVAAAMGVEFEYVHANLKFDGVALTNIAARYKGNGTFLESRGSDKRSIKLDLNKYVKGQKVAGRTTLNLHNSITDASYMNEALAYRTYREAGVVAPRTAYARVNVTAGSEHKNDYFGLYVLVENVDGDFTEENFGVKGGALFKPVTPNLFEHLGEDWAAYKQTYDPKDDPKKEEIARLLEACKFVTTSSDEEFAAKLGEFIDVEQFAKYMAVTVFLTDLDGILGPGQNFYIWLSPKDKKFRFIPWDQDHSFGQMRGSQEDREKLSIDRPWQGENKFLERVYKVEAFRTAYKKAFAELHGTVFKPERFAKQVDELAVAITPHVKDESPLKWRAFQTAVAGNAPEGGGGFMRGGAKPIKGFVPPRWESIGEQLAGKAKGNTLGNEFGMMRGPGPGGPGGPPRNFGPGAMIAGQLLGALDSNNDQQVTAAEAREAMGKLFEKWDAKKSGALDEKQLRAGLDREFKMPMFGPPPGG